MMRPLWLALLFVPLLEGCVRQTPPAPVEAACVQEGLASWYHPVGKTAAGDRPHSQDLIAAHRTLPFGTAVRVTALDSGRTVIVRIDDRGPFAKDRVIDLSRAAAEQLGMRGEGVARVRLEIEGLTGPSCPFGAT